LVFISLIRIVNYAIRLCSIISELENPNIPYL
jgi:hypothetical protein